MQGCKINLTLSVAAEPKGREIAVSELTKK
jgi:hypothetical protein